MWFNKYKGYISDDGARPLTDLENLLGGMSAGCFSTLGNNPFDVVKTKMQGMDAAKYKNTVDCFRQVCPFFQSFPRSVLPQFFLIISGEVCATGSELAESTCRCMGV